MSEHISVQEYFRETKEFHSKEKALDKAMRDLQETRFLFVDKQLDNPNLSLELRERLAIEYGFCWSFLRKEPII